MSATANQLTTMQVTEHERPLRVITASSLYDGHDAAINIMRRIIQQQGAEVIHLGHNRSVDEIVSAAIQEYADAIAISSYQGGHMEYFKYMIDQLNSKCCGHIRVFGGGGGTITQDEIQALQHYGVERVYSPEDGLKMGLIEMIADLIRRTHLKRPNQLTPPKDIQNDYDIATMLTVLETCVLSQDELENYRQQWKSSSTTPVIGITGTGGAGKSSVTDELINRINHYLPNKKIAVLAIDPSRRRSGGALLGDRIRMNSLRDNAIFMRSMATRRQHLATNEMLMDGIAFLKSLDFDLIIVETAGIGQSDTEIVDLVNLSLYVMTSDYGAASQLEKIDMLDYADLIVLNKFDKRGSEDALRDIRKQWQRNKNAFKLNEQDIPVYPTIASKFNDVGVTWLFNNLCSLITKLNPDKNTWNTDIKLIDTKPKATSLIPSQRIRYLSEIAEQGCEIKKMIESQCEIASKIYHVYQSLKLINDTLLPEPLEAFSQKVLEQNKDSILSSLRQVYQNGLNTLNSESIALLKSWPAQKAGVESSTYQYTVRDQKIFGENFKQSLSMLSIPKICPPEYKDWGQLLKFLLNENLPGHYPYTAGVYPYRRETEDPTRMFAGEGTPEKTNRRFHYLSQQQSSARLSTAFDSVTLYGEDPARRPDIYGKIGNAGVSIATLDDMKKLYSGFDLCAPGTSVSMTINGPAPIILAFFMNTAVDQQVEVYLKKHSEWDKAKKKINAYFKDNNIKAPCYQGEIHEHHTNLGLDLLGISGDQLVNKDLYEKIKLNTLQTIRGTVQADILKEDQAQNTCIFSTEFAMRMMGDVQTYFVDNKINNYYSASISGYHIAEAGANPITQLAFTLANGFTIVEYYLSRGMKIDEFAPNLSFFFSNGMDPEYTVIGRVARRIWARAMRERYQASPRSQMLKYHIQTSGRSLHAQEVQFNDIRTTLQALYAIFDSCNSLHTNAYDEAITTPTEDSVRRAVAIQMIINRELGLNFNENPLQGSFTAEKLTDLVEKAVYQEFERISERGGVFGAMDSMYQRSKIQEESMYYEQKKHDGSLPIIGVNTFLPQHGEDENIKHELARSSRDEKDNQIFEIENFYTRHANDSPDSLDKLKAGIYRGENIFAMLMETVKTCSLGQISSALYEVGGEYRRNM